MQAILIVDDEPIVGSLLETGLAAEDRRIIVTTNSSDAMRAARAQTRIDVAMVDKNLPDGSGLSVAELLRRMHPDVEWILMTAHSSVDSAIDAVRLGAFDYLHKPFDHIEDVRLRVDNALAKARLETQLKTAMKMDAVGRLASGVAHDFKNLLFVIQCAAAELAELHPEGSASFECVRDLSLATDQGIQLTQQLLAIGRSEPLLGPPRHTNEMVAHIADLLRRVLPSGTRIETDLRANSTIQIDSGQLSQVLLNLTINARDAMPEGGLVILRTHDLADRTAISVCDDGIGMSPETKARVFEPFFTTKRAGKGTGLGLATSAAIVHQHGGTLEVESQLGHGTTITLLLPLAESAHAASAA